MQDLHFQRKQKNFAFAAQFPSGCDQTSRPNRNIGKNPQDWHETRQGALVNIVVGTSLQQNDFNKEIYKDKAYETTDNTYEDLNIEMPKAQTLWKDKNDLWTWMKWRRNHNNVTKQWEIYKRRT